jgi:AmmeMemoRadiSam system protein A
MIPPPAPLMNAVQRQTLLALARAAVVAQVTQRQPPALPPGPWPEATGVFVTVKRDGELRGCLGTLECRQDLAHEVARCGADAASIDPRFEPVSRDELPRLTVEVSVLGPLVPLMPVAPEGVVVGRDGLVVEQGHRRGLLLPQVATERSWTPEQFLRQTCVKAGLAPDAWRRGAEVYRFEADVFGE